LPVSEPVKKLSLLFHISLDFIGHAPLPVKTTPAGAEPNGEPHARDGADA